MQADVGGFAERGIALWMDRIVKMFTNAPSLRDVVAFPKTTAARALFEGAPSPIRAQELSDLGLRLAVPAEASAKE